MKKQSYKIIAIVFAVFMIPAMVFASGEAEGDVDGEHSHERDDDKGRFHRKGRGEKFEKHGFFDGGALITEVVAGSPAEAAGLQAKDVIVAIGDNKDVWDLRTNIQGFSPGETVELTVARPWDEEQAEEKFTVISLTLGTGDDGNAYAGIQYVPNKGFGGGGKDFFLALPDLTPEEKEQLESLKQQMEEVFEQSKLRNSSL